MSLQGNIEWGAIDNTARLLKIIGSLK